MEGTLNPGGKLSPKESQIMWLLSLGMGSRQISSLTHNSIKTIEAHLDRMKEKLDCTHIRELYVMAGEEKNSVKI